MKNVRLGLFVVVGAIILTYLIFKMGSKSRIFEGRKKISVIFKNSRGLKNGNDVRFSGVNVGAVDDIEIENDSMVRVVMSIDSKAAHFIKKDSRATVSSEGLVGSKFVGITAGTVTAKPVDDGDQITAGQSFEIDEIMSSVSKVGKNAEIISKRLDSLSRNINEGKGVLGALLTDTMLQDRIENIAFSLDETGKKTNQLAGEMQSIPDQIDVISGKVQKITDSMQVASTNTAEASRDLKTFSKNLNNDSTTIGKIVGDTAMAQNIDNTINEVKTTAEDVKETSTKVRKNIFVRLFSTGGSDEEDN